MPLPLEDRVARLEEHVSELRVKLVSLESEVRANIAVTQSIKDDTAQIVALIKGGKALGGLSRWVLAILGTYFAGKGLKWW